MSNEHPVRRTAKRSKRKGAFSHLTNMSKSKRRAAEKALARPLKTLAAEKEARGITLVRRVRIKGYATPVVVLSRGPDTVRFQEPGGPVRTMAKEAFRALAKAAAGKVPAKRKTKRRSVWTISTPQGGQPGFRR